MNAEESEGAEPWENYSGSEGRAEGGEGAVEEEQNLPEVSGGQGTTGMGTGC